MADSITWRRFCRSRWKPACRIRRHSSSCARAGCASIPPWWRPIHPTDADLLDHGIRKAGQAGAVDQDDRRGIADRVPRPQPRRRRRIKQISHTLRRRTGQALGEIDRLTGEIADIATHTMTEVDTVTRNARRMLARRPPDGCTGSSPTWRTPSPAPGDCSLRPHNGWPATASSPTGWCRWPPRIRPIRIGKPQHPPEFGFTTQLVEHNHGFIPLHKVNKGNPSDARQLIPAVENVITATGRIPATVVAGCVVGTAANDKALAELAVRHIGLQRNGAISKTRRDHERTRSFRRMRNWRIGVEAPHQSPQTRIRTAPHPHAPP